MRFGGDGFNFGVDGAGVEALRAGGGGARLQLFEADALALGGGGFAVFAVAPDRPDFPDEPGACGGNQADDDEVEDEEAGRGVLQAVPDAEGDVGELEDDEEDDQHDEHGQQDDGFTNERDAVAVVRGHAVSPCRRVSAAVKAGGRAVILRAW